MGLLLLCLLPAARALTCSPYMGQVLINEVRVGHSNSTDLKNQVELFNTGNVAPTVWQTWTVEVWFKSGTNAAVKKGGYSLSSGHTANGQFIYNNVTKYWLQNRNNKSTDIGVYDASGNLVAYLAIEGTAQTVPGCYGSPTVVQSSGSGDETGDIMRPTDGTGSWPASLTKTSAHTISRTNQCTAGGGDLVVFMAADTTKAIQNSTTVTYSVTAFNNSCSTNVAGVKIASTNTNATYLGSLSATTGSGSVALSGSGHLWNIGTLVAGQSATLTISGKPTTLGALTTTASVNAPASGLLVTADDSDTETVIVQQYNYVGFNIAADSLTEGIDSAYSAIVNLDIVSPSPVTVNYSVSGTAGAGDTNLPSSGSVVIAAGQTSGSIDFTITNDSVYEITKSIVLTLTSVSSADTTVRIGTVALGYFLVETITLYDDDPPTVDHYELVLPAGSLACLASTVTINACANSSSPCTSKATTVSGATLTLTTNAGTLGASSVTFNALGVASTTLTYAAASNGATARVTMSGPSVAATSSAQCCPDGVSCAARAYCDSSFSTAGFIISSSAGGAASTIPVQTAGAASANYFLRAVQTNATTKACEAAITGVGNVNWSIQCNNPSTCSAGNLMTISANSSVAVAGNANGSSASSSAVPMTFDANGNAPFSFNYADVGQVTLNASRAAGGSLLSALGGSSNAFVVKPAGFALSNIKQTAAPQLVNPGAASASAAKFVKAGEGFSATVTALTSGGAATPNYGRETSPEGVLLSATLVLPAGGAAGTLSNAGIAGGSFSAGTATLTNLSFSEVGIITLSPSVADGDYLGAGNVTGSSSGNIGRFYPDHFAITPGTLSPACGAAFSYFGQDGFTTAFTLSAMNAANTTTQNYSAAFAKLGLTSWGNFVFSSASSLPTGSVLAASANAPSGSWTLGVAQINAQHQISRPAAPSAETNVTLRAAPLDSDGVTMAATALGAATPLRYGRLRLSNAFGSASQPLQVPVRAEYWSGNAWLLNSSDSCTTLPAAAVAISNPRNYQGLAASASTSASAITLSGGNAVLSLAAPSPAAGGVSFDLALNLGSSSTDQSCLASHPATSGAARAWLRSNNGSCAATPDRDPAARASFGIYSPESRKIVHVRELF